MMERNLGGGGLNQPAALSELRSVEAMRQDQTETSGTGVTTVEGTRMEKVQ
jgi:hypothetical protein